MRTTHYIVWFLAVVGAFGLYAWIKSTAKVDQMVPTTPRATVNLGEQYVVAGKTFDTPNELQAKL